MWLFMILCTLLYSVTRFSGLEYISLYFGNAFQVLHPESFPVDRYMPPFRATLLSLYYVVVRLVGDLWLDDRFTIVVYGGLVLLSLAALDKTARVFGADRPAARVAILSLMLLGYGLKRAQLVSGLEFNPTTMAGPAALWLLYLALAGARPLRVFAVMALLAAISVKNAWMPSLIGLAILFRERLTPRAKWRMGLCVLGLVAAALGVYYALIRPQDPHQVALFDFILYEMEKNEANPFWDTWWSNLLFLVLCAGAWWVRLPSVVVEQRVKTIAVMGAAVWLLGGLYLSYAPDLFKIPYVVPFDIDRGLWWPQYVLLVAVAVSALKRLSTTSSWRGAAVPVAILLVIYLTPFNVKRAGVVGALLGLVWLAKSARHFLPWRLASGKVPGTSWRLRMIAGVLCATTLVTMGSWTVHRWPALRFLTQHGIMGDNPGAKWVGINEYIREKTPPDSMVLALTMRDYPWRPERFKFEASLRTRTGRSMPFGHRVVFVFDYPSIAWSVHEREPHHDPLMAAWERQDVAGVTAGLRAIGAPDYLVVPVTKAEWLHDQPDFPYGVETVIGEFAILRKSVSWQWRTSAL